MNVMLGGLPFHYVENGSRDALPVVFLHGFPFSHAMWEPQLEAAGKRFRVIAYDLRGHGDSYVGDGQYSIEGHVDDLIALLDQLQIASCVIVGLSMGGYVTLRALERDPGRFRAAVLCDTRSEADGDETKLKRFASMAAVKTRGSAFFAEGFVKAVFAPASFDRHPAAIARIRSIIAATSPLSIAGTLLALASRTDTTPSLGNITIPVLIMVGESDATTPPAASRSMHERIPGSELHIIPDAAHMSNLENAHAFNMHLLAFLDKVAAMIRR
jgi:3-oxoadipate enol-lactonase